MVILDCPWENENLCCKTAEISFSDNLNVDKREIEQLEKEYDYIVIKVPIKQVSIYNLLTDLNYSFIETQISLKKNVNSFDEHDKIFAFLSKKISLESIKTSNKLSKLLDDISEDMFDTDRIYLDPSFGPYWSSRRYKNWIKNEYSSAKLVSIVFNQKEVGFALFSIKNNIFNYFLGGIFEPYKELGIGTVLPLIPFLYNNKNELSNERVSDIRTKVSSNNKEVLGLYMHYKYQISDIEYVFTKKMRHD